MWPDSSVGLTTNDPCDLGWLRSSACPVLKGKDKYLPHRVKQSPLQTVKCCENIDHNDEIHTDDKNEDDGYCIWSVLSHF